MRPIRKLICLVVAAMTAVAAAGDVQRLFSDISSQTDEKNVPDFTTLSATLGDQIAAASQDEIKASLAIAQRCLHSSLPKVREDGAILFLGVSYEVKDAGLIDPYIDDLGSLMGNADPILRMVAIVGINHQRPSPSAKGLAYLSSHLEDDVNSTQDILGITSALLGGPISAPALHRILTFIQKKGDARLTVGIIKEVGLIRVANEEALDLVAEGLDDSNPSIRSEAIAAAGRLRAGTSRFDSRLAAIAADPSVTEEQRRSATRALIGEQH